MIKSLELKNFQSHKDVIIDFHPGVNVITGSSRSGKTAVLRALNWNRYNKPAGLAFNSYWNRDAKKQPIDDFSARVNFDNMSIIRKRSASFNGYDCDGRTYEALGQVVPEDIGTFWNMTEVNIQKQFDTPFLISESAAEVARFFNKTIHLDKIDSVLSIAEASRRRINSNISENTKVKEELDLAIESLDWVGAAEKLVTSAEAISKKIESDKKMLNAVTEHVAYIKELEADLKKYDLKFENVLSDMKVATVIDTEIEDLIEEEYQIKLLLDDIRKHEQTVESSLSENIIIELTNKMRKADLLATSIAKQIGIEFSLENLISNMPDKETFKAYNDDLKKLQEQMPDTCPACGQQIKGGYCE